MKQLLFVLVVSLAVVAQQSSDAPASSSSPAAQPAAAPDAQATLIVFREKHFQGSGLKPSIYVDGQEMVRLNNGSYFTMPIKPGKHELASSAKHEAALEIEVKPGESDYVQMIIVAGTWRGAGRLVTVPAEDGKASVSKLKPVDSK